MARIIRKSSTFVTTVDQAEMSVSESDAARLQIVPETLGAREGDSNQFSKFKNEGLMARVAEVHWKIDILVDTSDEKTRSFLTEIPGP